LLYPWRGIDQLSIMTKFHANLIVGDIKIGVQVKGNVIGNLYPIEAIGEFHDT
jgi:hypothetical protein